MTQGKARAPGERKARGSDRPLPRRGGGCRTSDDHAPGRLCHILRGHLRYASSLALAMALALTPGMSLVHPLAVAVAIAAPALSRP